VQFFDILQMCVEELPAALARAFMMREWLELETAQICKEMNISATNCFVILHRARIRLRECLESRWFAAEAKP
jgi:RNA polymerase sigma-70 factor (ECF subfamily)